MKKNLLLLSAVAAALVFGVWVSVQNRSIAFPVNNESISTTQIEDVHYHAAFHHYIDGQLQDYSDFRFMSVQPCGVVDNHDHDDILDQVHLHDGNGEVVHVHAAGVSWSNLFESLGVEIVNAEVYVDGELDQVGIEQIIGEYERVLIFEDTEVDDSFQTKFNNLPSVDDIKEAETSSELCSS